MSVSVEFHPLAADEIVELTVNRTTRSPLTATPIVVDEQGSVRVRKMSLGGFRGHPNSPQAMRLIIG